MRRDTPADETDECDVNTAPANDVVQDDVNANAADVPDGNVSSDGSDESDTGDEGSGNVPADSSLAIPAISLHDGEGPVVVLDVSRDGRDVVILAPCGHAIVYHLATGARVFHCVRSAATRAVDVSCAAFSNDAMLLCTGDVSGWVCVWEVGSHRMMREFVTYAHIKWVAWHPEDTLLVAGTVDGIVWRWKMPGGKCKTMQGSFTTCGDGRILADGRRAAAVYDDGTVCIWDLKRGRLLHGTTGSLRMHVAPVTSLDVRGELVATGAKDVRVLHAGTGEEVATFLPIELAPSGHDDNNVATLSIESQQKTLAAGTFSGVLAILDLPSNSENQRYVHPGDISRVVWWKPHTALTSCGDGFVRVFDVRTGGHDPVARWKCSSGRLLSLALSPDGLSFVTSCNSGTCKIYKFAMLV